MDAEPESTAAPVPEVAAASTAAAAAAEPAVGEKRALECAAAGPTPAVSQEAASSLEAPFKRQQISRPIGRSTRETVFRLLASTRHAGYVIGKGGTQIKQMREETGARLKVMEGVLGSDERPIVISSKSNEVFEECPAQVALMAMYHKLVEAEVNVPTADAGKEVPLRLLVAQTQAGCLIGKGGVFIKQMRETTGADVRVLKPEELPLCALANDRVVQISGTQAAIEAALKVIALKLYENPPREAPGGPPPTLLAAMQGGQPQYTTDPSAMYHHMGGMQPAPPPGMPPGTIIMAGPMGHYGGVHVPPYPGAPPPPPVGASHKRTLMVPNSQVGHIIGAGGQNIAQIREKSGAQIKVHQQQGPPDPNGIRTVEITGLPHQVSAAENMIRAAGQRFQQTYAHGAIPGMPPEQQIWGMA